MNEMMLMPATACNALESSPDDWDTVDARVLCSMASSMHAIRAFEETVLQLASEGLVHGPAHSSIGQEGAAVGSILALRADDHINGSHRGHHQFLAKALHFLGPLDPRAEVSPAIRDVLHRALAEIMGLAPGFCRGRGGSMHLRWREAGVLGTNAIVGGGVPLAAGAAWAHKHAGTDAVAVTYFGDGAVNIGSVLETMNLASAWKLPLLFFIENNQYAVATTVAESTGEPRLAARGWGFAIPAWRVDGMDPLAVYLATQRALAQLRKGGGAAIVEADVYRFFHQNGPLPGSAFGYRTKDEEKAWRERDPLSRIDRAVVARGLLAEDEARDVRLRYQRVMEQVAGDLTERTAQDSRRVRADLWPRPEFRDVGIRGELHELETLPAAPGERAPPTTMVRRKFVEVIAAVIARRMEADPRILILGEDIHRLRGGTNGATRGLRERFPDRVLGTPISENAFAGLAGGIAMDGRFRPIVEFMYPDFVWVAADQVFNQIGKARHMFGGDIDVPLVLRTKVAIGTGYGSQHSMDPAGIFASCPGWRIAAPSTPYDYVGIMNAALACRDPVLVIEHVELYPTVGDVPATNLDYCLPPGRAIVRRSGSQATILTYLSMVAHSLQAVADLDADVEVVDLRWLDRASIDWETIERSVRKTSRVIVVEQGAQGTSYGAWLADEVHRRLFDWLDGPVERVTGGEASPSISKVLERAAYAGREEIVAAIEKLLRPA
ncbi:MAG: dehydrogenase component family protein [Steroidobacteraceae bacterium]|nr:dehydrogenase component family protein [Steroidobacteraceae bacterium]